MMYSNNIPHKTLQCGTDEISVSTEKYKKLAFGLHCEASWSQICAAATLPLPQSSWLNVGAQEQHFQRYSYRNPTYKAR